VNCGRRAELSGVLCCLKLNNSHFSGKSCHTPMKKKKPQNKNIAKSCHISIKQKKPK
jgi:hypothetical protein